MHNATPYRTLFIGTLHQASDMSTGGSGTHDAMDSDMPVAKDGQGRFILRGTTLAGALVYTLNKLNLDIPPEVSGGDESQLTSSVWQVHNSHLCDNACPVTLLRQYVSIDPYSSTAKDGALFDMEVLPKGQTWTFCLEVDTLNQAKATDGPYDAEQLAALALLNWQEEGLFIGRRVAAGTGRFFLKELSTIRLDLQAADRWPVNTTSLHQAIADLRKKSYGTEIDATELAKEVLSLDSGRINTPYLTPHRAVHHIQLSAGLHYLNNEGASNETDDEPWGLDGFFIGGHASEMPFTLHDAHDDWDQHLQLPPGYTLCEDDIPDKRFVADADYQPYIPGSSVRGVLRSYLYRQYAEDQVVLAELDELFGTLERSSNLYVGDAHLSSNDWQGMVLHNHAEDEFSAGVYGSNKFVRFSVIQAEFSSEIVVEAPRSQKQLYRWCQLLEEAFQAGSKSQLAIGAKQWVDSGWLKWTQREQGQAS